MTAVILFSHGSLLCGAGEQLELHAARLRQDAGYSSVEIGYLNYSSPSFGDAVEKCVNAGATKILISPYFLIPGYFIKVGLPRVLAPERERFPHIEFEIAPVLGDHELLAQAVSRCAANAQTSENWRAILHSAPKSCERNSECPLFEKCALTPRPPLPRGERRGDLCGMGNVSPLVNGINTFVTPSPAPWERGPGGEGKTSETRKSSLLVMVHGSPKPESNAAMFGVVERVKAQQEYSAVAVGFMECNEPSIPEAIENLVSNGAKTIVAVPYFLHAGTHVADDLPTLLEAAQQKYHEVEFLLGDYLGREELVTEVLRARLRELSGVEL